MILPVGSTGFRLSNLSNSSFVSFVPYALKGQKPLAQGIALGKLRTQTCRPVGAKALKLQTKHKAFALTGRLADCHHTQGDALG